MKKLMVLSFLIGSCFVLNAQQFKFGIRGGMNISSLGEYDFTVNTYEDSELESKVGLYAGIFGQCYLSDRIGLEAGLYYTQLGGVENERDFYEAYKVTADPSYLQIPVTIFYKFNLSEKFRLYPELGVYAGYGIAGKIKTEGSIANTSVDGQSDYFDEFANKFDAGGRVGLNFEYKSFILGAHYEHGFTQVNRKEVLYEDNAFNSTFRFTLAYLF